MPISKQTAMDIALAYREVEAAEELLSHIVEELRRGNTPDIRDMFGRLTSGLELGVPRGDTSRRLFHVPWSMARPIIEAHIANQKAMIEALTEKARIEMGSAEAITSRMQDGLTGVAQGGA